MPNACKVCGSERVLKALDLGEMPNANSLVSKEQLQSVRSYPLEYYWCEDCSFFQQINLIKREELFGDFYTYQTGVNLPAVEHFKGLAEKLGNEANERKLAIVIASNDGTEIATLKEFGSFDRVIGVEPAKNMAKIANDKGLFTINDFFSVELAKRMASEYAKADIITANGVFAHIPDPRDMMLGMAELVKDDGKIEIEVHWLKSLVDNLQIEALYGEHYYVWSIKAMNKMAEACGLKVSDVEYLPEQQGGSIRVLLSKSKQGNIGQLLQQELKSGLYDKATMLDLQQRADARKKRFVALVKELNSQKKRVSVWTVPAKIVTLLNFCALSGRDIESAYDITPGKIGRYIPGANILIKDEKLIGDDMPDYLILGAWNYIEFMRKKLKWYTDRGGMFINPLTCEIMGPDSG